MCSQSTLDVAGQRVSCLACMPLAINIALVCMLIVALMCVPSMGFSA